MPTKSRMPFRGLVDTFAELNRIHESWRHPAPGEGDRDPRPHSASWVPTTDIFASGEDVVIRCELAGVDRSNVELSYASGTLVISVPCSATMRPVSPAITRSAACVP